MSSPFKFLDAYGAQDQAIFFGRTEEIDQLYRLIFQTDLLLVYGASGTGKTSLVQCGLAGRFKPTDRFELLVRRKDNLNASLDREIRRAALTPIDEGVPLADAVQSLYLDHLRPVHLIFDQFEEIFVLGSKDEQRIFIDGVAALLAKQVACKVVIVMREEFIAMLYEFEKTVPRLFAKRFRVEPMSLENITRVITGTTGACGITLEQGETTARHIIENLSDHRAGVQLSYLQVYLDKLYREAARGRTSQGGAAAPIVFSELLVRDTGALEDVLASFLEEQTTDIQRQLKAAQPKVGADAVQLVLEEFTTLEGTKQPIARAELVARLPGLEAVLDPCLAALARSRVVRQTEEVYELSHDALARRIADNRSAERKTLLKVQKIVKDRFSGYEQTKTLLSKEELGLATPHLAKLSLSESETKFVTKSRWRVRRRLLVGLAATAAVVLGLFVGVMLLGVQVDEAEAQREEARKSIANARGVAEELLSVDERVAAFSDEDAREVGRDLLGLARRLNEQLDPGDEHGTAARHINFWIRKLDGDLALRDHDLDKAREQYQGATTEAEGLVEAEPDNDEWKRLVGISHRTLGDLEAEQQNTAAARAHFVSAIAVGEQLARSNPEHVEMQRDLMLYQRLSGDLELADSQFEAARQAYTAALAIAERRAGTDPKDPDTQLDWLNALERLGAVAADAGDPQTARARYRQAVALAERLTKDDPDNPQWKEARRVLRTALAGLGRPSRS